MVESLKGMPVTKFNSLEQAIYSNNPFTKGVLRYREIEEGLWILITEITFKANVRTRALYDKEECEYYFLSFSHYKTEVPLQNTTINKIAFPTQSWSLYRPGTEIDAYHYKGTSGLFFNFVFSKSWIDKNISIKSLSEENHFRKLLESEIGLICWEYIFPEAEALALQIWASIEKEDDGHFNIITLKIQTLSLITEFFKNAFDKKLQNHSLSISNTERRSIAQTEKIIRDNLTSTFPGIENIAKKVHLSPTKLKAIFKAVYGTSLLQFYNEKKMVLAMELLKNSDIPIKSIALSLGYESPGKFSATFKKKFKVLPSQIRNENG